MALKVVGAGLGRTGTNSLKLALEQLLGGPCYHMLELFPRPQHIPIWHRAVKGEAVNWDEVFEGFTAAVDWPTAAAWSDIHAAYPGSVVLLSERDSAEQWWGSFSQTILQVANTPPPAERDPWFEMTQEMLRRFSPAGLEKDAAMAAYEAHNRRVRDTVPADQLIVWRPADGWGPICAGLGLPEPSEPFPHVNTTEDFRSMLGLGAEH